MAVAPAAGDVEKQLNTGVVVEKAPAQTVEEAADSSTKLSDRPESFHSAESSFEDAEETPASSAKVSDKEEEEEEFKIPTDRPLSVPIPRPGPKQKPLPAAKLTGDNLPKDGVKEKSAFEYEGYATGRLNIATKTTKTRLLPHKTRFGHVARRGN